MVRFLRWVCLAILSISIAAQEHIDKPEKLVVGYLDHSPPVSFISDNGPDGLAVALLTAVAQSINMAIEWVPFHDRQTAYKALSDHVIQVLAGDLVHSDEYASMGIHESLPFFMEEMTVVAPLSVLTVERLLEQLWTDLLRTVLLFSAVMAIIFWLLLFVIEAHKNPLFHGVNRLESGAILLFEVAACFLRDLLYDPVTHIGRILFGLWMFFSVVMITIVLSIVTSTIIILSTESARSVKSPYELHFHHTGYIDGHQSAKQAITLVGGYADKYESLDQIFSDLMQKKNIEYAIVGKTLLDWYIPHQDGVSDQIARSAISVGYESWIFLYSSQFAFAPQLNYALQRFLERGTQYNICKQYITHPENCLVI